MNAVSSCSEPLPTGSIVISTGNVSPFARVAIDSIRFRAMP